MHHSTQGVVLNCTRYKDNAYIVSIFTRDYGKVSYTVYRPQSKQAKIKMQHLQPMSILEMEVEHRENRDIQQLIEAKLHPVSYQLYDSPQRMSICFFMAEVIQKSLESINADTELFHFIVQSIHCLSENQTHGLFPIQFLLTYSKYIGIYPYDKLENEWIKHQNKADQQLLHTALSNEGLLNLPEKRKVLQLLLSYYQYNLPGMGELKSLSVLTEIFSI